MADAAAAMKAHLIARDESAPDKELGLALDTPDNAVVLRWVREAIDELGWKHDAVAAALSEATGRKIDAVYFSKMLTGDKPFGAELLRALPDDIERVVAAKYAEAMGLIVVAPVRGEAAVRSLVAGLMGVLAPTPVPLRMAKASLRTTARKVTR